MHAVLRTGGKQYLVHAGDVIQIEKLPGSAGEDVVFDEVLLVSDESGSTQVGTPLVESASVKGKIVEQARGPKITVFKFKRRKKYRKKQGHRQSYTAVEILDINA